MEQLEATLYEGKTFKTFLEFEQCLQKYQVEQNVVYVTDTSCSIENWNKTLVARGEPSDALYNTQLIHKNIKLVCKFGGSLRIGRGLGIRGFQSSFKIGCPGLIQLIAKKDHLYIKKFIREHANHNCTVEEVEVITKTRKVHNDYQDTLDTQLDEKVRPSRIRKITPRDNENRRAKRQRKQLGGRTESEMLVSTLCEVVEEDPTAFVHVQKDENDSSENCMEQLEATLYEGKTFKTFLEFEQCLQKYQVEQNVVYVTETSCSIENWNKKLVARGGPSDALYNTQLIHKNIKLVCMFGGSHRIGRGLGFREFQSSYKIGCPGLIQLIANKDHLYIKKFISKHINHNCTVEEVRTITKTRKVYNDDQDTLHTQLDGKVRPSRIRKITSRDNANRRAKRQRKQLGGRPESEMLVRTLCEVVEEDPTAFVHVQEDENDSLENCMEQLEATLYEGKTFKTFLEFEQCLQKYQVEQNVVYVTDTSCSIENWNKKLVARGEPSDALYNTQLIHKNIKLVCKFGGLQRIGHGLGLREFLSSYKIGCPGLIHLIAKKDHLYIKKFIREHANHNCTEEEVRTITKTRKVYNDDQDTLHTQLDGKVRPSRIRKITPRITSRINANRRAKRQRKQLGGRTESEMLVHKLCEVVEEDPTAHSLENSMEQLEATLYEGKTFKTFLEFEQCLQKYQVEQNVVYVTDTSCSIENWNKTLVARGEPSDALYNTQLIHKNIKLVCKFGGSLRIGRGLGIRGFQSSYKIGCPGLIHLIAKKDHLYIKKFISEHANHNCTVEEVRTITKTRKVHNDDQGTLDTLLDGKVRPSRIRKIVQDTKSGRITPRDNANCRAKRQREQLGGRTESEMLVHTLCEIIEEDPNAVIHVQKDENDSLEIIFIQTSKMRSNVEKFGMVVFFDHTYKINKNRLPVSIFKVMDGNGVGRCAGLAYVVNEEKITLSVVVKAFKDSIGEDVAQEIRTVVIDKDYSEAVAIKEILPHVQIQLCDFYVSRTFNSRSVKQSILVNNLIHDMRFCESEKMFRELVSKLKEAATDPFWKYFFKNWVECPLAWSFRDKKKSPNLGRLEKFNATIKLVLDSDTPLNESAKKLLELVKNKEEDVLYSETSASVKHCYMTKNTDPVVTKMLDEITPHAAKTILAQKEEVAEGILCRSDTTATSCGCTHYITTFLPCAHILKLRMQKGLSWYEFETILPKYKKSRPEMGSNVLDVGIPRLTVAVAPAKTVPKTSAEKFNHALAQERKLAALLSECGQDHYAQRLQALTDLWKIWNKGNEATVVTIVAEVPSKAAGVSSDPVIGIIEADAPASTIAIQRNQGGNSSQPTADVSSYMSTTAELNLSNTPIPTSAILSNQESISTTVEVDLSDTPISPSAILSNQESMSTTAEVNLSDTPISPSAILSNQGGHSSELTAGVFTEFPLCFCRKPAIRLIASASSRIAGRPFWRCSQQPQCQFRRISHSKQNQIVVPASTEVHDSRPRNSQVVLNLEKNDCLSLLVAGMELMDADPEPDMQHALLSEADKNRQGHEEDCTTDNADHQTEKDGQRKTGLTHQEVLTLQSQGMLSDVLIGMAMSILKKQFPNIGGLAEPIPSEECLTRSPPPGMEHLSYKPCVKTSPYIQILNTGSEHWITCYKAKNADSQIYVLNSTGAEAIGSFTEQQLSLIMNVAEDEDDFEVVYSKVKTQEDGSSQCGPLAIAYATELAFTNSVTFVDFKSDELFPHLLKCLLGKTLEPFPRHGQACPAETASHENVQVVCWCRLPLHHDLHVVKCSKCREWVHYKCEGLSSKPTARHYCKRCLKTF